jgi:SAM-dependent methyltransferase
VSAPSNPRTVADPRRRWRRLERAFWSLHSRTWDDEFLARNAAHLNDLAGWLIDAAGPGSIVADLGCGTGNVSRLLATGGVRVVGVDFAPGMLARAQAKGVALVRGDLQRAWPIAPASLDGAASIYSMQFFDAARFIGEATKAIRPGGHLLVEVPLPGARPCRPRPGTRGWRWAFQYGKRVITPLGIWSRMARDHSEDELCAALTGAGFAVVKRAEFARSYALLAQLAR